MGVEGPEATVLSQVPPRYLHGEDDHREAHRRGDAHRHDDRLRVVKAGYHAHHVGQADGQDGLRKRSREGRGVCVETLLVQTLRNQHPFPVPRA